MLNSGGAGATFCFAAGTYRVSSPLVPLSNQKLIGSPGAIINGSKLVTSFVQSGNYWVAPNQTQQSTPTPDPPTPDYASLCVPVEWRCGYNEIVFWDDVMIEPVRSLAEVTSGKYFFDYDADKIYFADNPSGHKVEAAVSPRGISAFNGSGYATGVTVRGLTIEKCATPAQQAALHSWDDWIVEDNEVRLNHGGGIDGADRTVNRGNYVHHNGQLGMLATGSNDVNGVQAVGLVVEDNEVSYNNVLHFRTGWEAGGSKWVGTEGLIVRNNWFHHNIMSSGLWVDVSNHNFRFENNLVEDHYFQGISVEIANGGVVVGNTVRRSGTCPSACYGSAILVAESSDIEVYNNVLVDNREGIRAVQEPRGSGLWGPFEVSNLYVHDNEVHQLIGSPSTELAGLAVANESDPNRFFTSMNNRFASNTYYLDSLTVTHFRWNNQSLDVVGWQAAGQDTAGIFNKL